MADPRCTQIVIFPLSPAAGAALTLRSAPVRQSLLLGPRSPPSAQFRFSTRLLVAIRSPAAFADVELGLRQKRESYSPLLSGSGAPKKTGRFPGMFVLAPQCPNELYSTGHTEL
jgi:hypothetical protein